MPRLNPAGLVVKERGSMVGHDACLIRLTTAVIAAACDVTPLTALGLLCTVAARTGVSLDMLADRIVTSENGLDALLVPDELAALAHQYIPSISTARTA